MTGSDAAPLAELLKLLHGELAGHSQHSVKHGRHMTGIQEEAIARYPLRVLRIIVEILGKKHIDKVGATHGSAGMATLSFLHHRGNKHAHVIRGSVHQD